ncbi:alkaline phosphatase family protein [Shinella granuli]|uniref:Putative AlkP superfamily pyrophosphatase or phosphodiesterase n=1 Tax=Shinella granuli TaxID=323621 RepID=A0A4R2CA21_SHIGR|nr:alkaline phosphatase family protein [Shinella granuli]TCN35629.1 putative AlkP superfamily pyrophosphatase or phosphodiesterase [Shinella granuli]
MVSAQNVGGSSPRVVLVVTDGMRRDFISTENTPVIANLKSTGTWFASHRSVFPSCTRVVSSSVATGCLPAKHGLAGNSVCLIEDGKLTLHDAGKPQFVDDKRRLTGRVLNIPTMAERLASMNGAIIFNNVSPGAAYVHDPDGHGHVYHRAASYGPGRVPINGPNALDIVQGIEGDTAATERFVDEVVLQRRPTLAVLWLSEPDTTQHITPLGSPRHLEMLRQTDRNVARVLAAVSQCREEGEDILVMVASDHGHETTVDYVDIAAEMVDAGLKRSLDSDDVVVAPNGTAALIYVDPGQVSDIEAIRNFLESQPWCGQIFDPQNFRDVGIPAGGNLAFGVAMAWDDGTNEYGVPGRSYAVLSANGQKKPAGCGQHGGLGRYEQSPYLIAEGRGFKAGETVTSETSAVEIAPTVLHFLGRAVADLDGRALQELN